MDETAHPRRPRRVHDPPQNRGRSFSVADAARGRAGLGAENHDLDSGDGVGQSFVIRVGVELDHRHVSRERARDVMPEELAGADDQVQS